MVLYQHKINVATHKTDFESVVPILSFGNDYLLKYVVNFMD